jgi:long-chain acyl-CoA synthetase
MHNTAQPVKTFPFEQRMLVELNTENYTSLVDMFQRACVDFASRVAFSALGQDITFSDVERMSRNFATYLVNEAGLVRGDRIAIQLPNIGQYPIVAWGALRAGLVIVNTNPLYTPRDIEHQFNDSGAVALVALSEMLPQVQDVISLTGIRQVISTSVFDLLEEQPLPESSLQNLVSLPSALAIGAQSELSSPELGMNDIALLQYTGGTTGPAKGAVLTHGNVFAGSAQTGEVVEVDPEQPEIILAPMPLYHIYGFTMNVVSTFCAGGQSVLIVDPRDIDAMVALMKQHPFTAMAGINTLFSSLLQHPDFDQIDFSHVKGVVAGGAALVEDIADEWERRTGSQIFEGYGLSETTAVLTGNNPDNRQLGTVGKPMGHQEVKIVDGEGNTLGQEEEGELLVRGPQVMHAYWNRPEATVEALDEEGWFRTGDIAKVQHDGYVKICDRLKDMVLVSGFNVYPNEIEGVVATHPDILECAVVGVPDEKSGEAVKLYAVSSNPGLDAQSLREFCREHLTAYKVPRHVEFMDDLPKSNVGKILRRELRGQSLG